MKDSARKWLAYAEENLACARLVLENGYLNASLQNSQQAIEKALKALILEMDLEFRKTHSVSELTDILTAGSVEIGLTDDEKELLDSIYLPSKYPLGSALPDAEPDIVICETCIRVAERVVTAVSSIFSG